MYDPLRRYYGLMMWFPELFNRFDEYSKAHNGLQNATVCQASIYLPSDVTQINRGKAMCFLNIYVN